MNENEVQGTLKEDVSSLNDKDKANLTKMSNIAINDVSKKKGQAYKTTVLFPDKDGLKISIVAVNEENKKPFPAKDKLNTLGLNTTINDELIERIEEGEVNNQHITDIRKLDFLDDLNNLDEETQKKIINNIILGRNERHRINSDEMAPFVINDGKINHFTLDSWYRGMIRLIEKLIQQADVNPEIISQLIPEKKLYLQDNISQLIKSLDRFLKIP